MTNEELGRKWAERHGKRPENRMSCWAWKPIWGGECQELPLCILEATRVIGDSHLAETPGGSGSMLSYKTESEAYSALGAAIRYSRAGTVVGESLGRDEKPVVTT